MPGSSPSRIQGTLRRDGVGKREREREQMNVAVKKVEERKRLIFLGLHRKPIKPLQGTCSVHEDLRCLLNGMKVQSTFLRGP